MSFLQAALGKLAFEGEAAERLRGELRAAAKGNEALRQEVNELQAQLAGAKAGQQAAERASADAQASLQQQQAADRRLQVSANAVDLPAYCCCRPGVRWLQGAPHNASLCASSVVRPLNLLATTSRYLLYCTAADPPARAMT